MYLMVRARCLLSVMVGAGTALVIGAAAGAVEEAEEGLAGVVGMVEVGIGVGMPMRQLSHDLEG